ncbi:MAG: F0F1 ATP synthase subunit B' [Pseudomonadota bacterium]|nr:F0F1 ATP synthase subunit B' [Pseudomonadota bacterium]
MLLKTRVAKSGFTALAASNFIMGSQLSIAAVNSETKGLPQLDISTWPNQLLWLAVSFLVGYLLMAKVITPRIGAVLNTRRQTIFDDLKRAKDADAEAKQMKEDYESALETARITAAEAASKAMAEAKAKAEAAEVDLTAKLAKKTKAAEIKLFKMRDEALANIHDVAKELTLDTVSSVTGMKVKKTDADKAIKKVIKLSGQEA